MPKTSKSVTVITAPFILSFPKLITPEPYMEDGKPKGDPTYNFEGISTLDSLKDWRKVNRESGEFDPVSIEMELVALAKLRWPDINVKEAVKHGGLSWPFKSGDLKADEKGEHYRGKKFWRAKAMAKIAGNPNSPDLFMNTADGVVRIIMGTTEGDREAANRFYGGAIVTAELNAVADETAKGKYVTFYVNAVVFQKDGDRLGGGSNVERMYGVKGGESTHNPTEGMGDDLDDEIPF